MQSEDEDYIYYVYNHLVFTVKYHKDANSDSARIVGFEVEPYRLVHSEAIISELSAHSFLTRMYDAHIDEVRLNLLIPV